MSDDLLRTLAERVEAHRAAGDYDLAWLDAPVVPQDPLTPIDHYLRTPPDPAWRRLRGGDGERRLRDAITYLSLAIGAEQRAREGVAGAVDRLEREIAAVRSGPDGRVGNLERDIQALGIAIGGRLGRLEDERPWASSQALRDGYRDLVAPGAGPLDLEGAEARAFSQNGEDGIILHLFSLIGATDRRFVEIGIEDGRECNTANLALNFGWSGAMVDRDPAGVASAQTFYAARPRTRDTVRVVQRHVTREGVDDLLVEVAGEGPIDLLSIDIDGNDLWVWEAVRRVSARLVVMEYNASFGPERSVSIPYDPAFDRMAAHPSGYYHGASLTALTRLGARKGYLLAGCDSNGVNAFFVRSDCAAGAIAPADPREAWRPLRERGPPGAEEQFAVIAGLPLEEIH